MRIKIIGENNCARATRHLLRMAGFAVTEFLPAEAIMQAPHHGYAITIETGLRASHDSGVRGDLSPAQLTPDASRKNLEVEPAFAPENRPAAGGPSSLPDLSTHDQPASFDGEASALAKAGAGASAVAPNAGAMADGPAFSSTPLPLRQADFSLSGVGGMAVESGLEKGRQAEACPTGGGGGAIATGSGLGNSIHFDSVEGALEAAVLRHVAKLAAAPVIVDRPGGVVHSERELRIILPVTGNAKSDEAAAVAVEFGVLRGMLDLVNPHASLTDKSATGPGGAQSGGKKNLWTMFRQAARAARNHSGIVLLAGTLLAGALFTAAGSLQASPRLALSAERPGSPTLRVVEARGADGAYLHLEAALAPAPAQGQFAAGELNIALIGGAAVSGSLYDSVNTALKVNCVTGCGTTTTFSDNAAFTAGSTAVNTISAVFNDSIAALTSGNAGAVRSTSDRMLYVNVGKLGGTALSGANVVDSGNTAFRVNCVVGCSAAAGFTDNSAFTAGTTTESNIGGVYNDGLSTLSSGNAAAARITSARALHINLRNSSGTEIGTSSNPVRVDPVGTTTQPVFWSGQSVSLSGTLPAFASTPAVNLTQLDSTALGAPSAYGTSPGAVNVPGVNAYVTNSPNVALNSGTNTIGSVKVTDGTNTVVVDPCKGQTKNFVSINQTVNTQLASGTASKKIYICSIHVVVAAATNVALVEGTGSVCATSTTGVSGFGGATAATGWNFAANGGIALGNGDSSLGAEGTAADNLCVYNSGSGQVSGGVSYVVQ